MNHNTIRLVIGIGLAAAVSISVAQRGVSRSSGGGGGHYSGGGGSRSSGGTQFSGRGSGYSGGNRSGGSQFSGAIRSGGASNYRSYSPSYSGGGSSYARGGSSYSGARSESRYSGSYSSRGATGVYHSSSRASGTSEAGSAGRYSSHLGSNYERSHTGQSAAGSYSANNNRNVAGLRSQGGEHVGQAPHGPLGPSGIGSVIGRGGRGSGHDAFRHGYFGYGRGWRDSFFFFPFYCFDPWFAPCFVSPWYYYPCLPPYVAAPNVILEDYQPDTSWRGSDYTWAPESQSSANPVLDDSVQDIVQSFEADDHKAIDRVTPHSGNVKIFVDGKYSYSLKANDFYDTYVDGIESTKTDRYEVLDVKASADKSTARVTAKHVYNDPWGKRTSVNHSYFLVKEGSEYVIREFGTTGDHNAE